MLKYKSVQVQLVVHTKSTKLELNFTNLYHFILNGEDVLIFKYGLGLQSV